MTSAEYSSNTSLALQDQVVKDSHAKNIPIPTWPPQKKIKVLQLNDLMVDQNSSNSEDDEYTNGIAPKRDITNQDEIVNKNACLIPSLIFFFLNEKYKIIPIKNVIKLE